MKKTLYDIMNEAEASEMTALLENIECETPASISTNNIKAKTLKKCGVKEKKARALILRYGAVAACLALIIATVPTVQNFIEARNADKRQTELGIYTEIDPSIAYANSISYTYYFPLENGEVLCEEVIFKLEEGKLKETWKELLAPFFEHCALDVSVTDWKLDTTGEKDEISADGNVITHTVGVQTLTLYLDGTVELDDHTLKCLVNTIDSITYVHYIKLVYNGVPVSIEGECPEQGFTSFK